MGFGTMGVASEFCGTISELFWNYEANPLMSFDLSWNYLGTVSKRWNYFVSISELFWNYSGTILELFWNYLGTIWELFAPSAAEQCWNYFGTILELFWNYWGLLELFLNYFVTIETRWKDVGTIS